MNIFPKSVSQKIINLNPSLWQITNDLQIDLTKINIVSGSSFVDSANPTDQLGNPFTVVIGSPVETLTIVEKTKIAQYTNTPETVFINKIDSKVVTLTVLTPSGVEMGACAHGFLGALQVLMQTDQLSTNTSATIKTTLNTSAEVIIKNGLAGLTFTGEEPRKLEVSSNQLSDIYGVEIGNFVNHDVLSVGSAKLVIELTAEEFEAVQQNLKHLSYEKLLKFQQDNNINGIHIFCRDLETKLPKLCIQNNAFSGPDNLADRATGVSNAAQIIFDNKVNIGQALKITQFSFDGASAILDITKLENKKALVGGSATLFNSLQITNINEL